jgi:hypothetical protein
MSHDEGDEDKTQQPQAHEDDDSEEGRTPLVHHFTFFGTKFLMNSS